MGIVSDKYMKLLGVLFLFFILIINLGICLDSKFSIAASSQKNKSVGTIQDANILRKELALVLPSVLENPSYKVVFKNPSSDPIELSIDGKTYKNIKSPFTLPNLSVGKHTLVFKYTNKQGVLKILSTEVLIVPRKPIINSKQRKLFENPEPIIISGTAIPNGTILMIADGKIVRQVDVDSSGTWAVKLEHVKAGMHTFMFFSTVDGIINPTPVILDLEYKDKLLATPTPEVKIHSNNIVEQFYKRIKAIYSEYKDVLVYIIGVLLAIVFALFLLLIKKHIKQKEQEKTLAELLNLDDADIVEVLEKNKKQSSNSKKSKRMDEKTSFNKVKSKKRISPVKKTSRKLGKSKKDGKLQPENQKKSDVNELEVNSAKSIHVEKIKVALPKKGKKVLSKEEFLKRFKRKK